MPTARPCASLSRNAETLSPPNGNKNGTGWQKIVCSCRQAIRDGLDWVWIDTCCIDKSSSAELSEAINSMFRWHQAAVVCYVHLADLSTAATQRNKPVLSLPPSCAAAAGSHVAGPCRSCWPRATCASSRAAGVPLAPWPSRPWAPSSLISRASTRIGNQTIQLDLPVLSHAEFCLRRLQSPRMVQVRFIRYAMLLCGLEGDTVSIVAVPLEGVHEESVIRTREIVCVLDFLTDNHTMYRRASLGVRSAPAICAPRPGDVIFRRGFYRRDPNATFYFTHSISSANRSRYWASHGVVRNHGDATDMCAIVFTLWEGKDDPKDAGKGFYLCLRRAANDTEYGSSLHAGLFPFQKGNSETVTEDGVSWLPEKDANFGKQAAFSHTFACPADHWNPYVKPLFQLLVNVEKMAVRGGFVDVVDWISGQRQEKNYSAVECVIHEI